MRYFVCTPIYDKNSDGYWDPPETGADVVEVEATNKREALVKGLRLLRQSKSEWICDKDFDKKNPFNGLSVAINEGIGDRPMV